MDALAGSGNHSQQDLVIYQSHMLNLMFSSDDNSFFQMLSRSAWGIGVVAATATDILMERSSFAPGLVSERSEGSSAQLEQGSQGRHQVSLLDSHCGLIKDP
ncbi:hypothetical protein TWF788_002313 [Orbilia oligospora]|uniref:Uncharacterized protein n=1 Tax=Orbilia oligospora TaxID=2813651 RepID=A0A6G1MEY5_ORBOL|nr:hypothetical protein TWF788_002313 [Orbilia oligospora]KAF3208779.1 hypothetical protein TWF679_007605 [Orbilia oligospora]KAF3225789.1 hypothetical protein TWF191_005136 [Orbilia oligospora]KAF3254840.1 hypothetical protein TWF192_002923 [Orbilia oligospora]